jgi:hypothetical protein
VARSADLSASVEIFGLMVNGARLTLMFTASSRSEGSPDM